MARLDARLGGLGAFRRNRRSESGVRGEVRITGRGGAGLPASGYPDRGRVLRAACAVCLGLAAL